MKTRPVLIGLVNALIPGLGYLIIKERTVFGTLILVGMALSAALIFAEPTTGSLLLSVTPLGKVLEGASYILILLAFGYDAYDLAARANRATPQTPAAITPTTPQPYVPLAPSPTLPASPIPLSPPA